MKILEPIRIGTMEVRNRLVMAPMTTGYAGPEQEPSAKLIAFLAERARGGVGLITTEACVVDARHREVPHSMHFSSDDVLPAHRALVDAVHEHGAKIQPQLVHAGPDSLAPQLDGIASVGPSVIPSYLTGTPCRQLAAGEVPAIADQYAGAARRIRAAGYDGLELHAAHGYMLLGSFLSPWRNKRSDDYAARQPEGRLRFLLEVLAAMRREIGGDFPITLRISGYERIAGGRTIDDTARLAPRLVAAGVDAFHVSGGVIDRLTSMIITGSRWPPAHNLSGARSVKNVVDVPVITVGRIHDPLLAEKIVAAGDADLVAMGRPFLADPELAIKLRQGRAIRPCISCETCVDSMERSTMTCAVNGRCGREGEVRPRATPQARRVVVVGGGPAGLEAARVAAARGHRVSLYEKERFLGGALMMAATVHAENQAYLDYLTGEVERLPIDVRRGAAVSPDEVCRLEPDVVVVATGGRVVAPAIPGDDQRHVFTGSGIRRLLSGDRSSAEAARLPGLQRRMLGLVGRLSGRMTPANLRAAARIWTPLGERVAIIGGDLAALEVAELLATLGRRVAVFEAGDRLAPEVGHKRRAEHMDRLDHLGVAVHTGIACQRITGAEVVVLPEGGASRKVAADSVIVAGTVEPNPDFFDCIRERVRDSHAIGDCTGLGLIRKATEEGMRVGAAI